MPQNAPVLVITRPYDASQELSKLLDDLPCEVRKVPLLELQRLPLSDGDLALLSEVSEGGFDLIVAFSQNAVGLLREALDERQLKLPGDQQVASQGPRVAAAWREHFGIERTQDTGLTQEGLADQIGLELMATKRVLVLGAKGGRSVLAERLRSRGVVVSELKLYQAVPRKISDQETRELVDLSAWDVIVFMSPSAVDAAAAALDEGLLKSINVASIGPVTTRRAKEHGLTVAIEPADHSSKGLKTELEKWFAKHSRDLARKVEQ